MSINLTIQYIYKIILLYDDDCCRQAFLIIKRWENADLFEAMKMRRFFSVVIVLMIMLSLAIYAAAEAAEDDETDVHECGGIVFDIPLHGTVKGTLAPGNYYLDGDCVLKGHVKIADEVRLCLNGYSVSVEGSTTFHVQAGGEFSIYDCSGKGIIGHYNTVLNNHPLTVDKGGTANIYGGWLYGMQGSNAINSKGTVNVYGGRIESSMPGYAAVRNEYELNIYGGEFIGCIGITQRIPGEINIYGSEFSVSSSVVAFQNIRDASPLKIHPRFYAWRTDPDGEFKESADTPFVPDAGTVYVEFAPLIKSIEYITDGVQLPDDVCFEYVCGEGCEIPEKLDKEGYDFLGWFDVAEN